MHGEERTRRRTGRPAAGRYVAWAAGAAGIAVVVWAARDMVWIDWGAMGIMSALAIATGWFAFPLGEDHHFSFSTAVFVAAIALFGTSVGAWVAASTALILTLVKFRLGTRRALLAFGLYGTTAFLAGTAYRWAGGRMLSTGVMPADVARLVILFAAFAAVTLAVKAVCGEEREKPLVAAETEYGARKGMRFELVTVPLAFLLVMSYTTRDVPTFPLLAILLVVISAAGKTLSQTRRALLTRLDELRTLNRIGQSLSPTLKMESIVEQLYDTTSELIHAAALSVCVRDDDTSQLVCCTRSEAGGGARVRCEPWDEPLVVKVVNEGKTLHIMDLLADDVGASLPTPSELDGSNAPARTWLGLPLIAGQRTVGALVVTAAVKDAFSRSNMDVLATLANQLSQVVDNAKLYEGLERSREDVERWNHTLEERVLKRTEELAKARAELQALNESLERRFQRRTEELEDMQAQLIRSGKLAAVGELAAGVAHELNSPIAGILGYAQYDLEKIDDRIGSGRGLTADESRKLARHLAHIERQSQYCREIVENLLRFSQESQCSFAAISINDIVKEALGITEHQLSVRGIELDADLEDSLPLVIGDRQQLQQVFANIIMNARDAMSTGGELRIRTRYAQAREGRGDVSVEFQDTGCGILDENIPRVFEPFFTTNEVGHGAGLGLSVSYGIVKEHGGEIDVESSIGEGATFTVRLPIADCGAH